MTHPTRSISNLSDLFSILEKTDRTDEVILFRGQREDLPLLPKIARNALWRENGVVDSEKHLFDTFCRCAVAYLSGQVLPASEWDWLALAQHHGLPTRLLDWTSNALTGLWFAVKDPAINGKPGVLWMYQPTEDDQLRLVGSSPFKQQRTGVFHPNHITRRIAVQAGTFMVHAYFPDHGGFIPFEENTLRGGALTKFSIPADSFPEIRYYLDRCGVNEASLFPDLDGLAHHLHWAECQLSDEGGSEWFGKS